MSEEQGAHDSAKVTHDFDDWKYENYMREVEPPPSQQVDPWLYRIVVYFLGGIASVGVIGSLVLPVIGVEVPAAVGTAVASCIVGLVALLSTPAEKRG